MCHEIALTSKLPYLQIVAIFALVDLVIWVQAEDQTSFGVEKIGIKGKLFTWEFLIRFSKILFIAVMFRKVWKTIGCVLP